MTYGTPNTLGRFGEQRAGLATTATESCKPKETAVQFAHRELQQIIQRLEVASNRLSAAKKRLQEHFGVPVTDSQRLGDQKDPGVPVTPTMDSIRVQLDVLDCRFQNIAEGMEELV